MTVGVAPRTGRIPTLAKYDVLEELGHGGMATVYRAHDKRLGRDVAVKVIHPHLRDSREVAHRFFVEAQAVAKLRHPNIVEVYDVSSEEEPEQYLVVELLRGRTLRKLLQAHGALPPEVAAAIGVELLGALAHAHAESVVHRDIKPENVIIEHRPPRTANALEPGTSRAPPSSQAGDRVIVKLTDFGIAKLLDAQGMTSTGQVLGSPAHMAPEQIEGGDVDGRADVFGLGVLLYECMVGHLPFEGNNPAQVLRRVLDGVYPSAERERPTVGKAWSLLLDRALARKAEGRFSDATAMREALLEELRRLGITNGRAELEAWADEPEGYEQAHDKAMITRLCDLAAGARKRGDAIAAAADYNRALAYAPHDPTLLRIVTSMHRAELRRALLRRIAPLSGAALAMGALAFLVTRALHTRAAHDIGADPFPTPIVVTAPLVLPPPGSATASASPPTSATAPVVQPAVVRPLPTAKVTSRQVVFGSVQPPQGVKVAVDDDPAMDVVAGHSITLDTKAHTMTFSCPLDVDRDPVCDPVKRPLEAGDHDVTIPVRLTIKPALLLVEGDSAKTYRIEEYPKQRIVAGEITTISLVDNAAPPIHVYESESGEKHSITLRAGKQQTVTFGSKSAP